MDITTLKKDQIFGSSELEIFKKRGVQAAISDYAICCGGFVSSSCYIGNNQKLENRTGWNFRSRVWRISTNSSI